VDAPHLPTLPRLLPLVEVFPASDDRIYLLRGERDPDLVIEDAGPRERALLALLAAGGLPVAELTRRVDAVTPGDPPLADALAVLAEHGLLEDDAPAAASTLDAEELARYARQLAYLGAAAQERLRDARVTILGVGGLGSWALSALACAGVGFLRIVDHDSIELSNLNRQLLYRRADVGRPKVEVAAEAIAAFNPTIAVEPLALRASSPQDVAAVIEGADVAVVTADWPMHDMPRWVNRACLRARTPWIGASQLPPLVRVGPLYAPGRSACAECQERAARRAFPLYDELEAWREVNPVLPAALGWASGLIGTLLAGEVVHQLTGVVQPATLGTSISIDLRTLEVAREPVARDADCPACGGYADRYE
jgi:bacteriocin biosynthesis cyclodehydratase domain-containing protein